ncbi:PREDICTED: uncharacterized protein LOC109310238 [Crocodylus porosus]|uniref:uncharacterized protein LOC109310238 n=1 Tax=Crocodylus porosus TaxID=8502 RepID=UPI00093C6177|nr:PREDICTED: uncharacterized protein LOC109310238 [Crocodylus porosus]
MLHPVPQHPCAALSLLDALPPPCCWGKLGSSHPRLRAATSPASSWPCGLPTSSLRASGTRASARGQGEGSWACIQSRARDTAPEPPTRCSPAHNSSADTGHSGASSVLSTSAPHTRWVFNSCGCGPGQHRPPPPRGSRTERSTMKKSFDSLRGQTQAAAKGVTDSAVLAAREVLQQTADTSKEGTRTAAEEATKQTQSTISTAASKAQEAIKGLGQKLA